MGNDAKPLLGNRSHAIRNGLCPYQQVMRCRKSDVPAAHPPCIRSAQGRAGSGAGPKSYAKVLGKK
jgi:hypothetical protein